ncbi:hypothetical protein [Massilia antarctica]|uniref:hypothetical protein n=1 Tax=Massilia antarctica TaxID=2765360 RepID=UPI0006BB9407|nr:hypothetical protein [Massilia sp. H27-R4]MCY0910093.1 hypothetical protein [Massilia sp. H27-R4]CUI02817.1 hypothetical protein BN2497_411 [Janthinobacterium sp. CG23_2]CUU26603.1 hypothetical protein BN3177_411 [Janthinobacterium sp. CG23_2]
MVRSSPRWTGSDAALRSLQVAFDVEKQVIDAVRYAAFKNQLSPSDQIRHILGLPCTSKPVRPRLTVSLSDADYAILAERFGLAVDDKRKIKESLHLALIEFARGQQAGGGDAH